MAKNLVFLDADVLVSSLFSEKGASWEILKSKEIKKITSLTVQKEVIQVAQEKLKIGSREVKTKLKNCPVKSLGIKKEELVEKYQSYVFHQEDSHVVAGAHLLKANFLLTYNSKHFCADKIKNELGLIVLKPGFFLQYLRSKGKF